MEFIGSELIFVHLSLSIPLLLPPLWNLYALFANLSHTKKLRTLAVCAPAYYTLLSASAFSGFVIWAMLGFVFTFKIILMLTLWIVVLVAEIKRHKFQKQIRMEADFTKREKFFLFAKIKYSLDFCTFVLLLLFMVR
ncbi:hypothetical protein [Helicobacter turcicus]|uniref:DUF2269 family protein n=1 Tax=Helicobacter turcicus TaxID=2867412 RepID=A0ABS7JML5_9HELI|nr:hypothetical protein [Helicobacter turcicus]MBX7490638.1 hypothetical protein [Helicobacter turcicus]MBX7545454.1 hypothetical protein [Helicobacter turcicus]